MLAAKFGEKCIPCDPNQPDFLPFSFPPSCWLFDICVISIQPNRPLGVTGLCLNRLQQDLPRAHLCFILELRNVSRCEVNELQHTGRLVWSLREQLHKGDKHLSHSQMLFAELLVLLPSAGG